MKWEYLYITGGAHDINDSARRLGRNGWEMVNISKGEYTPYIAFFKRPLVDV